MPAAKPVAQSIGEITAVGVIISLVVNIILDAGIVLLPLSSSEADIARIVESALSNNQIYGSFDAHTQLKRFIMRHAQIISKDHVKEFLSYS